jgi:CheY-like chemotaxis protein
VEAIRSATSRGEKLTRQLLAFSRSQQLMPVVVDLRQRIDSVRDMLTPSLRGNIELVCDIEEKVWPVEVDLGELELALVNIAVNARDAMPDGGTLTLSARNVVLKPGSAAGALEGDYVALAIIDTGSGMSPEVVARVFEPFYTTKPVGKGTGLGLSICQEIVRDHGGEIRVESHARRGTTFVIEVPIVPIEEPEELVAVEPEAPRSYSMLNVLAVDDEQVIIDLLSRALTGLGHEVDTALDGAEALRMINLSEYDAILLDVKMPGLGGPEVLRCIEGLRPELVERVLFITGDTVSPSTQDIAETYGRDVLHKPFSIEELRKKMQQFAVAKDLRSGKGGTGKRPDLTAGISRITRRR